MYFNVYICMYVYKFIYVNVYIYIYMHCDCLKKILIKINVTTDKGNKKKRGAEMKSETLNK